MIHFSIFSLLIFLFNKPIFSRLGSIIVLCEVEWEGCHKTDHFLNERGEDMMKHEIESHQKRP